MLDISLINKELTDCGIQAILFQQIDSTNSEAIRRIHAGLTEATLFIAEQQTGGRGRRGRSFYSPAGTGIYMTLAVPVSLPFSEAVRMPGKTSAAVLTALDHFTGKTLSIKWVNDIYKGTKKVAGVLVEALPDDSCSFVKWFVIGAGINVDTRTFPEELITKAGSLELPDTSREEMIGALTREILREVNWFDDHSYLETYRNRSCVIGKEILYGVDPDFQPGYAEGIDDMGRLLVKTADGSHIALSTGEISIRFPTGPCSG